MGKVIPIFPAANKPGKETSPQDDFYWSLNELQRIDYDSMGIRSLSFWESLDEGQREKYLVMIENSEQFTGDI